MATEQYICIFILW